MKPPAERGTLEARIDLLESVLGRVRAEFATFSGRLSHDMQGIFRDIGCRGGPSSGNGPAGSVRVMYW